MKHIFFQLSFVLIIIGCSSTSTNDILPPEKMEAILIDQFMADAFTKEYLAKDTQLDLTKENFIIQERIFKKHKTDKNTFYRSYKYYIEHESAMKPILDSILSIEGKRQEQKKSINVLKNY